MATSYQQYTFPPINATSSSPSTGPNDNPIPSQSTLIGGENPSGILKPVQVDANGNLIVGSSALPTGAATEAKQDAEIALLTARLPGSFANVAYDYCDITYVAAGNGIGQIETVVYKTGGSGGSTVATLTLAYNSDNKLISVTRS